MKKTYIRPQSAAIALLAEGTLATSGFSTDGSASTGGITIGGGEYDGAFRSQGSDWSSDNWSEGE